MAIGRQDKVIIIGAGIGGLTLASALRKKGIAYEIHDRDAHPEARHQGWNISLRWFIDTLKANAPADAPPFDTTSVLYGTDLDIVLTIYHDSSAPHIWQLKGEEQQGKRLNRTKLRNWLLLGHEVQWNSIFDSYTVASDGKVTVKFTDGRTSTGSILVGADGTASKVRNALYQAHPEVPHPDLNLIHLGSICAEVTLDADLVARYLKHASVLAIASSPLGLARLQIGCKTIAADKSTGEYFWVVYFKDTEIGDPSHWQYSDDKNMLLAKAKEYVAGMHPDFVDIVDAAKPEDIRPPIVLRDMIPQVSPAGSVTLLGDAIHSMTPFRGEGGNNAAQDSLELADALGNPAFGDVNAALRAYEEKMVPRAKSSVEEARSAAYQFGPGFIPASGKITMKEAEFKGTSQN